MVIVELIWERVMRRRGELGPGMGLGLGPGLGLGLGLGGAGASCEGR